MAPHGRDSTDQVITPVIGAESDPPQCSVKDPLVVTTPVRDLGVRRGTACGALLVGLNSLADGQSAGQTRQVQPFETSRLILRGPRMTDLQPLTEMWTDGVVAQFMDDYGPRDPSGVHEWLTQIVRATDDLRQSRPSSVQLTLARKADSAVVGWLGLGASNRGVAEWDFGYAVHPAHRGNGYAAEALAAAVDGCRRRFRIASFWGECHQANAASALAMTMAGFSEIAPGENGNRRFVFGASEALTLYRSCRGLGRADLPDHRSANAGRSGARVPQVQIAQQRDLCHMTQDFSVHVQDECHHRLALEVAFVGSDWLCQAQVVQTGE